MTTFSILVAADQNNGIGKNNQLPWHISQDLKNFKQLTKGKTVIMGRKTWESLPVKPLPNRTNIVISTQKNYYAEGAIVFNSIEKTHLFCQQFEEVFIIGGSQVYNLFFPLADKMYLTRVHAIFDTDTKLEGLDLENWLAIDEKKFELSENTPYSFSFITYQKKPQK